MQNYYVRFGRRHPIPSTVEILDELRSGYVPGYVRKSWAQYGFTKSGRAGATLVRAPNDPPDAPIAQAEWCKRQNL
jgi:hypothetical protein